MVRHVLQAHDCNYKGFWSVFLEGVRMLSAQLQCERVFVMVFCENGDVLTFIIIAGYIFSTVGFLFSNHLPSTVRNGEVLSRVGFLFFCCLFVALDGVKIIYHNEHQLEQRATSCFRAFKKPSRVRSFHPSVLHGQAAVMRLAEGHKKCTLMARRLNLQDRCCSCNCLYNFKYLSFILGCACVCLFHKFTNSRG